MAYNAVSRPSNSRLLDKLKARPGLLFGLMIVSALIFFEMFNYSTTDYALRDLLGGLTFLGLPWATILSIAFCGIDFAGIARLFTPNSGRGTQGNLVPLGAWLLAATMNAILTWWGVSMAIANHARKHGGRGQRHLEPGGANLRGGDGVGDPHPDHRHNVRCRGPYCSTRSPQPTAARLPKPKRNARQCLASPRPVSSPRPVLNGQSSEAMRPPTDFHSWQPPDLAWRPVRTYHAFRRTTAAAWSSLPQCEPAILGGNLPEIQDPSLHTRPAPNLKRHRGAKTLRVYFATGFLDYFFSSTLEADPPAAATQKRWCLFPLAI